jgi:hypothetical protein
MCHEYHTDATEVEPGDRGHATEVEPGDRDHATEVEPGDRGHFLVWDPTVDVSLHEPEEGEKVPDI